MIKKIMRIVFAMLMSAGCLIGLAACGFQPVYGPAGDGRSDRQTMENRLNAVDVAVIPDYEGQVVRNHLIDRMYLGGYPSDPDYRLEVSPIDETIIEIGIDKDDNASRAQLRQAASMRLIRLRDGETVLARTVTATTGYNILEGQFTTYVTESDARVQALRTLSDRIMTQLQLYMASESYGRDGGGG